MPKIINEPNVYILPLFPPYNNNTLSFHLEREVTKKEDAKHTHSPLYIQTKAMDMKQACLVVLLASICITMATASKPDHPPAAKGGATPPVAAAHGATPPALDAHNTTAGSTGAASPTTHASDEGHSGSTTAPSAHNGSPAVLPAVRTLIGASLLSIVVFYAQ